MIKIYLSLDEFTLGYLSEKDGGYIFHASSEDIKEATKKYPIKMKFFTLNKSGIKEYKNIPNHYIQYLDNIDRKDIVEKAKILESDTDFQRLHKLTKLNLNVINFKIS